MLGITKSLAISASDPNWKDPQIFSPKPQPASGGTGIYPVSPRQRLLRLDFAVNPRWCRPGKNLVLIRIPGSTNDAVDEIVLEKLEIHVHYHV
jgi:hypothetical protein